ncbi:hypothetical protein QBC41DRAFT_308720 [Cercophora samala]|uniref:Uncharacterized protein n=1 Tax=Cercophora samala TaxID=330535 RepID=A0AA40DGP0_9PEZI|nr:hypothetical protein QBC41DRAFT_308720 [Cercophora samala]
MKEPELSPMHLQARQEGSDTVPAVCFSYCDSAYLEAQRLGESPELCQKDAVFLSVFADCTACLKGNTDNARYSAIERAYIKPNFQPWLDFCSASFPTMVEFPADYFNTVTKTYWKQQSLGPGSATSFLETVTQILPNLKSFNLTVSDEATGTSGSDITSTNLSPTTSISTSATQTELELDQADTSGTLNRSALIGVIVGSVIGGLLLLGAIAFMIRQRRRQKTNPQTEDANDGKDEFWGKAQLHGDSLPVKPTTPPQELPNSWLRELPDSSRGELPLSIDSTELPISPMSKELHGNPMLPRYELDGSAAHLERKGRDERDNMF